MRTSANERDTLVYHPPGFFVWSHQTGCCVKRVGSGKQGDRVTRDRTTDVRDRRVETRVDLMGSAVSVLD